MDTLIELTAYGPHAEDVFTECVSRLAELEQRLSVYHTEGDIYALNHSNGAWIKLNPDAFAVLNLAKEVAILTDGAFDPTVFPAVLAWDSMSGKRIPSADELNMLKSLVDYRQLELEQQSLSARLAPNMQVDLGGIAKGYAADELRKIYEKYETCGIINLGGNVLAVGQSPFGSEWRIGIRHPRNNEKLLTAVEIESGSVVTSGDYQRYFEQSGIRYHHILDPNTLCPAENGLISATVLHHDSALADALSTATIVLGPEKGSALLQQQGLRAILVTDTEELLWVGF